MSGAMILAFAAMTIVQQTDTVVPLDGADRLVVEAPGGTITVTAWDRREVRIQASHDSPDRVEVTRRGTTLDVGAGGRVGPPGTVRYVFTVPRFLDLHLEGRSTRIEVEGVDGDISTETLHGDIRIVGGRGTVRAASVAGGVVVEGASGRVDIDLVGGDGRLVGTHGEIYAESVGGSLVFDNVQARIVEAETVGGRIVYDGEVQSGGRYSFGSHGGSVTVRIPEDSDATVGVATLHGHFHSDLPGAPERMRVGAVPTGERQTFTVGDGGAVVEVETFGGDISLVRRDGPLAPPAGTVR